MEQSRDAECCRWKTQHSARDVAALLRRDGWSLLAIGAASLRTLERGFGPTMSPTRGLRVLMLLENDAYPQDGRVVNEAQTLSEAGHAVTVICPARRGQASREVVDGVHVRRFRPPPAPSRAIGYIPEYAYSMAAAFLLSLGVLARGGFDVIHAHNPPDTLVLIGGLYKLLGKRFVFDHHDLTPEMFAARFRREPPAVVRRALIAFERLSLRTADAVIATNASYRQAEIERAGIPPDRITIVRNGPDLASLPSPSDQPLKPVDAPVVLGFLGEVSVHDGVDYLLRAVASLVNDLGQRHFVCCIVGDGDAIPGLRRLADELGIADRVEFAGWLDGKEVHRALANIDIGVEPAPSNPYNDACTMIKLTEYMAFAKPAVGFDLPENRFTADAAALFVPGNDPRALAQAIASLMEDSDRRREMGRAGRARIEQSLAWSFSARELLGAYERLSQRAGRRSPPAAQTARRALGTTYQASRRGFSHLLIEGPRGLETSTPADLEALGVAAKGRVRYEPSGWVTPRRVFRWLAPDGDVLLDLGAGKGRVLLAAAQYPFRRVVGVEISEALIEVARRNVERSLPRLRCKEIQLVSADMAEYELPDDVTVVYLFNPVRGELFGRVIDRIVASYDRSPRPLRIVYRTPLEEPQLLRTGRVRLVREFKGIRPWSRESSTCVYELIPA
jgi:glycosyltransferase involved in cell wall biosynthesis